MNSRETIAVAEQSEIQIYAGDTGYVVIRQEHQMEDASVITVLPHNVQAVIDALKAAVPRAIEFRAEWVQEGDA